MYRVIESRKQDGTTTFHLEEKRWFSWEIPKDERFCIRIKGAFGASKYFKAFNSIKEIETLLMEQPNNTIRIGTVLEIVSKTYL